MCSQDLLVSTLGGSSGARECYRTAFGFSGDRTTLDVVTNGEWAERKKTIQKGLRGRDGRALLRSKATPNGEEIRVPLVDKDIVAAVFAGRINPVCAQEDIVQDNTYTDEQSYSISTQPAYTQETLCTPSVDVERSPSYSLGFTGLPNVSTPSVETQLKHSNQKQRLLTEEEKTEATKTIFAIDHEGKRLTLNAIKTRTELNWTVDDALKELCTKFDKHLS